jgi:hypothetical protein
MWANASARLSKGCGRSAVHSPACPQPTHPPLRPAPISPISFDARRHPSYNTAHIQDHARCHHPARIPLEDHLGWQARRCRPASAGKAQVGRPSRPTRAQAAISGARHPAWPPRSPVVPIRTPLRRHPDGDHRRLTRKLPGGSLLGAERSPPSAGRGCRWGEPGVGHAGVGGQDGAGDQQGDRPAGGGLGGPVSRPGAIHAPRGTPRAGLRADEREEASAGLAGAGSALLGRLVRRLPGRPGHARPSPAARATGADVARRPRVAVSWSHLGAGDAQGVAARGWAVVGRIVKRLR